jgi:hypothetical protein
MVLKFFICVLKLKLVFYVVSDRFEYGILHPIPSTSGCVVDGTRTYGPVGQLSDRTIHTSFLNIALEFVSSID